MIFSTYCNTDSSVTYFFQNMIVSTDTLAPSFAPNSYKYCSSRDSSRDISNSRLRTTMSILDKYLVNSVYLLRIIPTKAFTDTPILSASSSRIFDISASNRNDLVTVAERASVVKFGDMCLHCIYNECIVINSNYYCYTRTFCV